MKQPGAVCKFGIIGDIFQKHGEWFSKHPALKKANIIDPGRILEMKFEQMFNRPLAEFDLMNLSKTDAKSFKDELKFIIKSFEGGQVNTKLGEYLWSTQERTKNAPQLANVYNKNSKRFSSIEDNNLLLPKISLKKTGKGKRAGKVINNIENIYMDILLGSEDDKIMEQHKITKNQLSGYKRTITHKRKVNKLKEFVMGLSK